MYNKKKTKKNCWGNNISPLPPHSYLFYQMKEVRNSVVYIAHTPT